MSAPRPLRWISAAAMLALAGCAHTPLHTGRSCVLTKKPRPYTHSVAWHLADVTLFSQLGQDFDLLRMTRRAIGQPTPSVNLVNGAVADSSFFVNRDVASLTPEQVRLGPTLPGQEPHPPYVVTKWKDQGKTVGFFVTDARHDRYLMKIDLPDAPELITGAEVVTSKLLYALGYYVPSYEVVELAREDVTIGPKATVTPERLAEVFDRNSRGGKIRVSASRLLDGEIVGPFSFKQYRRYAELRALKLAYAWTNNTDAKDHNTLLVWDGHKATGYLIDFGTSLGADPVHGPQPPCRGWLNDVDVKNWTLEVLTLGAHENGCDPNEPVWSPAVGRFSVRLDPEDWEPYAPNLAFEEITRRDAEWMASRLAQFSRAQIEAAVVAGQYHHPEDGGRIVEVLEARRKRIIDEYLKPDRRARPIAKPPTTPDAAAN